MTATKLTLVFPVHIRIRPEDLLQFVEERGFLDDWSQLGLDDHDFSELQVGIMSDPARSPLISGSNGLREGVFRPERWPEERQLRVRYVWFRKWHTVALLAAYDGDPQPMPACQLAEVRSLIRRDRRALARRACRLCR